MMNRAVWLAAPVMAVVLLILLAPSIAFSQPIAPNEFSLDQLPRIYGLTVAASPPSQLLLATAMGMFLAGPDGKARAIEGLRNNIMAFAVHPTDSKRLLAGGHTGQTGSIGVLLSTDGGSSWQQISQDAAEHVGFHLLEISKADPNTVFGVTNGLHVSADSGRTWTTTGRLPSNLIHLAASAIDVRTLYAATRGGLLVSRDQGTTWQSANAPAGLSSMVYVTTEQQVYAFVLGKGLIRADERKLQWVSVSNDFADQILLRMVQHPSETQRLYAVTVTGTVVTSADGGKRWIAYEGSHNARPAVIAKGKQLFTTYCQACHGAEAKGQHTTPDFNPSLSQQILAPALDDSAHGWHHSDENLINTILNGSPRDGSPMIAWKNQMEQEDAEALVAYVKSLWSFRSIACQGARHMACMRR